jgi:hypothetical protein
VTVQFDEKKGMYRSKDCAKSSGLTVNGGGISFGSDSFSGTDDASPRSLTVTFGASPATRAPNGSQGLPGDAP